VTNPYSGNLVSATLLWAQQVGILNAWQIADIPL
jgi:hypothetical protein